jgi:hypothetical protein
MRQTLGVSGVALLFLHSPFAFAELVCVARSGNSNVVDCENRSGLHRTTVTYRNIPPWGGNAGATLVDICDAVEFPQVDQDVYTQQGYVVLGATDDQAPTGSAERCVRRYCSQDSTFFSLQVNGLVFPISPTLCATLSIGFEHARFQIRCETLR